MLQQHLATFLEAAAQLDDGVSTVPRFVHKELRAFLDCGVLARGLVRLHCAGCAKDHVIGLSCKGLGFCPRCGGRRMTETAAHLIDHVIPAVPVRQWVLTVPHALRYRIGYDHDLCQRLLGVLHSELQRYYRRKSGRGQGHTGSVTFVQRFNSALALSPHFHLFALDGVFVADSAQGLRFVEAGTPSKLDVAEVVQSVRARIQRMLQQGEDSREDDDPLAAESPALAACYLASVTRRTAFGPSRGKRMARFGASPNAHWVEPDRPHHAHLDGFDLQAAVAVAAEDRQGLEKLLRYGARPAVSNDRLRLTADGCVVLELKRPYHDGTTHLVFEPLAFIERLAALVPRPHKNLVLYHGVLSPNAKLRSQVIAYRATEAPRAPASTDATARAGPPDAPTARTSMRRSNYSWAHLMRRAFGVDVLRCPQCGGRLSLLAAVMSPKAIRAVLASLGLPIEAPELSPARAPPEQFDCA